MRRLALIPALALLTACGDAVDSPATNPTGPSMAVVDRAPNFIDQANELLAAQGSEYQIAYAELLTTQSGLEAASPNIIIARDLGNKRLGFEFIPNDPRRAGGSDGDPNTIDTWIDLTQGATGNGLTVGETTNAINRAMTTWDGRRCSDLGLNVNAVPVDIGLVQAILGFGGGPVVSDVMHAGWLPAAFFDLIRPGGSSFILGVTFTLTFIEGDLNNDGLPDLGAREIYYNDAFPWADDGSSDFDVETIAFHEAGHGLSQAHFGKVFFNPKSGKVNFSPRAIMNAVYSGVNRSPEGTDNAGHCGLWGNWPQSPNDF
jgi:hypothetical protein